MTNDTFTLTSESKPKKKTPSVTQVLKLLSDQYYKNIDRREMIRKAKIGTAIHKLIDQEIKNGLTFKQIDAAYKENSEIEPYFKAFLAWYNQSSMTKLWRFVCSETKLQNDRYNGTIDLICERAGEYWVIDVKTTDEIKPFNRLQVAAYAILLKDSGLIPQEANIHRAIVNLKQDRTYDFLEFNDFFDCVRWLELLNVYEFNKNNEG